MNELDIIKQIYSNHQRPIVILNSAKEFIWCNMQASALNIMSCCDQICKNTGIVDEFEVGNDIFFGRCELRFCKDICQGIYIAEVFVFDDSQTSALSGTENHRLSCIIRDGVSMISSSLQLLYDELGDAENNECIVYLNNSMLGCYDMLRGISASADAQRAIAARTSDSVVDFSCLVDDFFDELVRFSTNMPVKFEKNIETGIFVKCDYDSLYNAVSHLVLNVCRKNIMTDITIVLEKSGNNALFSVNAGKRKTVFDESFLRKNREFEADYCRSRECIGSIINTLSGTFVSHNSFSVPMCSITSIPLKSAQIRYKSDRFSKCRILLSDIYKIDFFSDME